MTEPWFSPETYAMLPGLVVSLTGGLFGALTGSLIMHKNFKQYFAIITILTVLVFTGLIVFGVIANFYEQSDTILYDSSVAVLIGLVVVVAVWFTVRSTAFKNNSS